MKRYLFEEMGIPNVPNSPKPVFRLAFENNLLGVSIERWLSYAEARIGAAHGYSGEKAKECLILMDNFIQDAVQLYQTLSKEKWR